VLYTFPPAEIDGWDPQAVLIAVSGALYGTTFYGGSCVYDPGCSRFQP
jgi:hypothetical protein